MEDPDGSAQNDDDDQQNPTTTTTTTTIEDEFTAAFGSYDLYVVLGLPSPFSPCSFSSSSSSSSSSSHHKNGDADDDDDDDDASHSLTESGAPPPTLNQIKKSYYRKAKIHHPDKAPAGSAEQEKAKRAFQLLSKAYSILSNENLRRSYDSTAEIPGDDHLSSGLGKEDGVSWDEHWRALYRKIDERQIDDFRTEYQGSEEERNDIKKAYLDGKGSMNHIYSSVMCSSVLSDDDRFRGIIKEMINRKEVPGFEAFLNEKKSSKKRRKKKAEAEAKEAEEMLEDIKNRKKKSSKKKRKAGDTSSSSQDSLVAMIQNRRKGGGPSFLDALAAKYAPKPKKGSSKKKREAEREPTEEEFDAARKRLINSGKGNSKRVDS